MYFFVLVLILLPWSYSFIKLKPFYQGLTKWLLHVVGVFLLSLIVGVITYVVALNYYPAPNMDLVGIYEASIGAVAALVVFVLGGIYTSIVAIMLERKMYGHSEAEEVLE